MRLRPLPLLAIPTAAIVLTVLAGCVPTETTPTPTATPSPSATIDPTLTPTPSASAEQSVPVTIGCDQLITPQRLYDYNPNFALESGFTPSPGSLAAQAVSEQGVACSWVNLSSGDTIVISVAHLSDAALTDRANDLVTSSNPVPTYEAEGYFLLEGGIGTAQVISPPYWVTATSKVFFEPGDVAMLMTDALAALG